MAKHQLSLCILRMNREEPMVFWDDMKDFVDEILIMDFTTKGLPLALAQETGVHRYQMEKNSNEVHAKNHGIQRAKGRWLLFLYENEFIHREELKGIGSYLDNPNVEGYLLQIVPASGRKPILTPNGSLRLIRNRQEYQYDSLGRIPDEVLSNVKTCGIRIIQQGALQFTVEQGGQEIMPEGSFYFYQRGVALLNQQQYKESIPFFQKSCEYINLDYLFAPHLYKCLCWAYLSLKEYQKVLTAATEGIKNFPFYLDIYVLRGEARKQLGQYQGALEDLEKGLTVREKGNALLPRAEVSSTTVLEALGDVHNEMFNQQQALDYYLQAYGLSRNNQSLLYKIGSLSNRLMDFQELEKLLAESRELGQIEIQVVIMDILLQHRQYDRVLTYMNGLEAILGKGETTAGIQYCCYRMLGQEEKARHCLTLISKDSPLNGPMILEEIEGHWANDRWQQGMDLLKVMDKATSLGPTEKSLYWSIHQILTTEKGKQPSLDDSQYQIISRLMGNFLWLGQLEKARRLLPLLLNGNFPIDIAEAWARLEDEKALKKILLSIADGQKQRTCKALIIGELIRKRNYALAQRLWQLGDSKPLGPLTYLLEALDHERELADWVAENFPRVEVGYGIPPPSDRDQTPSQELLKLHRCLINKDIRPKGDSIPSSLPPGEIHREIAGFYEKQNRKSQALVAYFRSLQWEPLHHPTQEKIKKAYKEDSDLLQDLLERRDYSVEGNFVSQDDFRCYILGMVYFRIEKFHEALTYFLKIAPEKLILAYCATCLWMLQRPEEAVNYLKIDSLEKDIIPFFFYLCKSKALSILERGQQEFPHSELIALVKQRLTEI